MLSSNSVASDPDTNAGPRRIVLADQSAAGACVFNASGFGNIFLALRAAQRHYPRNRRT